jgi:hypothetical protein
MSRNLFLTRASSASLLDGSVLRWQASHLLLIRTNLGYGTTLTAACARQGRSATDYYYISSLCVSLLNELTSIIPPPRRFIFN